MRGMEKLEKELLFPEEQLSFKYLKAWKTLIRKVKYNMFLLGGIIMPLM